MSVADGLSGLRSLHALIPSAPLPPGTNCLCTTITVKKVDDSTVSGPNAYVSVESLNEVPGKLRGVTHVFARQVSSSRCAINSSEMKSPFFHSG